MTEEFEVWFVSSSGEVKPFMPRMIEGESVTLLYLPKRRELVVSTTWLSSLALAEGWRRAVQQQQLTECAPSCSDVGLIGVRYADGTFDWGPGGSSGYFRGGYLEEAAAAVVVNELLSCR